MTVKTCGTGANEVNCGLLDGPAEKQNHELEAEYSTKYSKYLYQLEKNRSANFYITWLYVLYYFLFFVFTVLLFVGSKSKKINRKMKAVYIIAILVFPYIVVPIELKIKELVIYLYDIILGRPSTPSKWAIMGETKMLRKYGVSETDK
jgi:hypothetical protein